MKRTKLSFQKLLVFFFFDGFWSLCLGSNTKPSLERKRKERGCEGFPPGAATQEPSSFFYQYVQLTFRKHHQKAGEKAEWRRLWASRGNSWDACLMWVILLWAESMKLGNLAGNPDTSSTTGGWWSLGWSRENLLTLFFQRWRSGSFYFSCLAFWDETTLRFHSLSILPGSLAASVLPLQRVMWPHRGGDRVLSRPWEDRVHGGFESGLKKTTIDGNRP